MIPKRQSKRITDAAKLRLHKENPHCHWCGVLTILGGSNKNPDKATLDHIRSRLQCKTWAEYTAPANHVLACLECNNLRDQIFLKTEKPIEKMFAEQKRRKDAVTGPAIEHILAPAGWQQLSKLA